MLAFWHEMLFPELFPRNAHRIISKLFDIFPKLFPSSKHQRSCRFFAIYDVNYFWITQIHNFKLKIKKGGFGKKDQIFFTVFECKVEIATTCKSSRKLFYMFEEHYLSWSRIGIESAILGLLQQQKRLRYLLNLFLKER